MKLSCCLICALCSPALGQAPSLFWGHQFGSAESESVDGVAADGAGGTIIMGYTHGDLYGTNAGPSDLFIARHDASGVQVWARQFGTPGFEQGRGLAVFPFGRSVMVGSTTGTLGATNFGGMDAYAALHDLSGNQVWLRQFGTPEDDYALGVDVRGVMAGIAGSTDGDLDGVQAGDGDAFVALHNTLTNQLSWVRQLGTAASEVGNGAAFDNAGGVYLTGFTEGALGGPNAGGSDAFIAHYDSAGALLWVRQFGSAATDNGVVVEPDGAGGALFAGYTFGDLDGTQIGGGDIFLARYDSAGNQLWIRQFGTPSYDYATGLTLTPTGTVLFTGVTWGSLWGTNLGASDAILAEFDPIANTLLWSTQFGTVASDRASDAAISDQVIFATGTTLGSLYCPTVGSEDGWHARFGGCPANCDGSTIAPILNVSDFICFQTQFAAGAPAANCDGSTISPILNVSDFVCFLVRYAVGCP